MLTKFSLYPVTSYFSNVLKNFKTSSTIEGVKQGWVIPMMQNSFTNYHIEVGWKEVSGLPVIYPHAY